MMPTPPRSGLSSRNSFDGNNFPRQAGKALVVSKRDNGLISPAQSSFSFADEDDSALPHVISEMPDIIDEKAISRSVTRGAPGDAALMSMVNKNRESTDLSRRKSQFYSEVFAYREPNLTARDRVHKYSVITAEVKTNVIVSSSKSPISSPSHSFLHRSKTSISSSRIFRNTFLNAINGLPPQSSSPSPTQPASSSPATLTPPTSSPSPPSPPRSSPQQTSAMQP